MTNPSIAWTDGIGAASLVAAGPTFPNWTPDVHDVGDSQVPMGDNATFFFAYRQDFLVAFDVNQIAQADLPLALRLKSHLVRGGSITINTEDALAHVYTASLAPDTVPTIALTDTTEMESTLHLELVNASSSPFTYSPVAAPSGRTLTLETGPLFFQLGGPATATLTATLTSGGAPVVGATIAGVSNSESSFTVSPASGVTDGSGQVVFTVTQHLVGTGSVHAVAGSDIASVDVTVGVWEWDENFGQADYATFHAEYSAKWQWNSTTDAETYLSLAGGILSLAGDGTSSPTTAPINFGPDVIGTPFVPVGEWWAKLDLAMTGGAYDGFGAFDGGPMPAYFAFYGAGGEVDLDDDAEGDFDPSTAGHFEITFDAGSVSSAVSPLLPVGTHTFIVCLSNNGTVSKAELWIDAARGDAPNATKVGTYLVGSGDGDGMDHLYLQFSPPHSAGRVLEVHRVHFIGVPRAYDPFNIL